MPINAQLALKRAQIRALRQAPISIYWTEHPVGAASLDATVGTMNQLGVRRQCETRLYFAHHVPASSSYRANAEVEAGDCILDVLSKLYRVAEVGESGLTQGDAVDTVDWTRANSGLSEADQCVAYEIKLSEMGPPCWIVIDGEGWVQKKVGASLRAIWDSAPLGVKTCQTVLLRREPAYDHLIDDVMGNEGDPLRMQ